MKNKKMIISTLVIILTLVCVVAIVRLCLKLNKADSSDSPFLKDADIADIIEKINKLNANFTKNNFNENTKYEEGDRLCYEYMGNSYEAVNAINELYRYAYSDTGAFNLVESSYEEGFSVKRLYVCFPQNCTIGTIDKYEIIKDTQQEDYADVKINNGEKYLISKFEGTWKFDYPILICK